MHGTLTRINLGSMQMLRATQTDHNFIVMTDLVYELAHWELHCGRIQNFLIFKDPLSIIQFSEISSLT